jgi:hypothetical protein
MQSLKLHDGESRNQPVDLELEASNLKTLLLERRAELVRLQEELRAFKARYTQIIGSLLAELGEVERSIKEAEAHRFDLDEAEDDVEEDAGAHDAQAITVGTGKAALRKLFWSVARLFHPDHATDELEARRRHAVMAEASRAYTEGDVDSLHTLLTDEQLQFFCASAGAAQAGEEEEEDLTSLIVRLKGEVRTIEFGIKRIEQNGLYLTMLKVKADEKSGRDTLASMAEDIKRQIKKARRRLEHLA